jgi:flagellar assembly factor FliW
MDWKIEVELLLVSPFLFMAFAFGVAETAQTFLAMREERRRHASEV